MRRYACHALGLPGICQGTLDLHKCLVIKKIRLSFPNLPSICQGTLVKPGADKDLDKVRLTYISTL
jgi:hypothetical protein